MQTWTRSLIVLGAVALMAGPTLAQQPGGRGPGGRGMGMGFGGATLVGIPAVQEELKLSEEQASKVQEIVGRVREKMQSLRGELQDVPMAERMEKARELMAEVNDAARKELAEVLERPQLRRLRQIELQTSGAEAFANERIQRALELTEEQKGKVEEILADAAERRRALMQDAQGDFQAAMGKVRELRDETQEKITALLTDEQSARWKELRGEPFELNFRGGRGGRGGQPNN